MEIGGYIGEGLVAPVWVRGLKHTEAPENLQRLVAPVWVRGLKLVCQDLAADIADVAPVWVRGLKPQAA